MAKRTLRILSSPFSLAYGTLILAFVLRLLYWRDQWIAPLIIVGDEGNYYGGAIRLAQGSVDFWHSDAWHVWFDQWLYPPLYSLSLAGPVRLLGQDLLAVRLFQVLVGTLTVALVYRLGRALFDARTGAGAALLAALYWPLVTLPVLVMSEVLFIPLLVGSFILLVEYARHGSYVRLGAAGLLLALTTLTRAIPTLFFAAVLLWLLGLKRFNWRAAFAPAIVFVLGAGAVFVPWAARNYSIYGRLLLTDTMGAYNLGMITNTLDTPVGKNANLVDRQSAIVSAGTASLLAHPERVLENIVPNTLHLLRLEALYRLTGYDVPDSGAEAARDLILEDGVFLVTVLASIVGLVFVREWQFRSLILLWVGYIVVLLVVVYFSSVRYRLPNLLLLMPHAAYGLRELRRRVFKTARVWQNGLAFSLCASVLILSGMTYPGRLAQLVARNVALANAAWAGPRAQRDAAARSLEQAQRIDPQSPEVETAFGDLYRASGDSTRAVEAYQRALRLNPDSLPARFRLMDLWRTMGQNASAAELVDDQGDIGPQLMEWAWAHPELLASKPDRIDVGGLDTGYVRWMYPSETTETDERDWTFRWTRRFGQVRLFPSAQATVLSLRLCGWRPQGVPRSIVIIRVNEREVTRFLAPRLWRVYNIPLPSALPPSQPVVVTLETTNPLIQPEDGLDPPQYGMQLDWVQLGTAQVEE